MKKFIYSILLSFAIVAMGSSVQAQNPPPFCAKDKITGKCICCYGPLYCFENPGACGNQPQIAASIDPVINTQDKIVYVDEKPESVDESAVVCAKVRGVCWCCTDAAQGGSTCWPSPGSCGPEPQVAEPDPFVTETFNPVIDPNTLTASIDKSVSVSFDGCHAWYQDNPQSIFWKRCCNSNPLTGCGSVQTGIYINGVMVVIADEPW